MRGLAVRMMPVFGAGILVALGWAWGAQRIAEPSPLSDTQVVLMDSGVPQDQKWEVGPDAILNEYIKMMTTEEGAPGDIILWPEGAIPVNLLQDPNAIDIIDAYLGPRVLIAGTTRYEITGDDARDYFNSLTVVDQSAARSGPLALYDKHRLVPFGELAAAEIIPFGNYISGILPGAMQRMATDGFKPGPGPAVIYADNVPPFVAMICYEGLFPSIPRNANLNGRADWLVLISNDAWFGGGMGPAQHYAQNRYRAIETGLPMARVASRGASAIVDGYGREVLRGTPYASAPEGWSAAYGRGRLPVPAEETIYQHRIGIVLFWLSLCLFAGLAFASWRR